MQEPILTTIRKSVLFKFILAFFIILAVWWVSIFFRGLRDAGENNFFTLIYPLMSLVGGVAGLWVAKNWGGFKSYMGGSISLFSFGLLAQFFGQASYAFYIYAKGIEIPYPSIGDIGFFGSVIFYIGAAILLAKVSGIKFSLKSFSGKLQSVAVPLILLMASYVFFLHGYEYDASDKLRVLLDFGYPLGQAIYVSIALLALLMCKDILGGVMKKPIIFLIFALIIQYLSDFTFLYQASRGTWYVGGTNDFLYFVSYFLMSLALIYIGSIFTKIKES